MSCPVSGDYKNKATVRYKKRSQKTAVAAFSKSQRSVSAKVNADGTAWPHGRPNVSHLSLEDPEGKDDKLNSEGTLTRAVTVRVPKSKQYRDEPISNTTTANTVLVSPSLKAQ